MSLALLRIRGGLVMIHYLQAIQTLAGRFVRTKGQVEEEKPFWEDDSPLHRMSDV
jgi:hypothetical protein